MNEKIKRYGIGAGLLILAIIILVIGFNLIRSLLTPNSNERPPQGNTQSAKKVDLLAAPQSNQQVQFTTRGAINGQENHRSIRITIDNNTRRIEILQGYNEQIIKSEQFDNNREAYTAFIKAINGAGFASNRDGKERGDEAQSCPLGRIFSYELAPGTSSTFRTWTSSCDRRQGTFNGNTGLIQQLFQKQIPNYNQITSGVNLS